MLKTLILKLIKGYKKTSFIHNEIFKTVFLTDRACRYSPTCSDYSYKAVEKYGAIKGGYFGIKRILRCHPWSKSGYDPVR